MEHRKIPYGIQLLGRGGLSYFPRREIEGTGRISDLTDEGELVVYKPDTKEVAHTYEVDDEDDEDAVRNMMYDMEADIEDIYNVNIFADKIKLAKLEGGLQAKNRQIDKIKEEIEFAKKLISTKSVKGSKDEETLKEIQKMIDEINKVTIPKVNITPEARRMGKTLRISTSRNDILNMYEEAKQKSLQALTRYKKTENSTNKSALKKADIDVIKFGLDVIKKNPNMELGDIKKDVDKRIKQINTLVTYGGKYANVNGELVQLEKEKPVKEVKEVVEKGKKKNEYIISDEDKRKPISIPVEIIKASKERKLLIPKDEAGIPLVEYTELVNQLNENKFSDVIEPLKEQWENIYPTKVIGKSKKGLDILEIREIVSQFYDTENYGAGKDLEALFMANTQLLNEVKNNLTSRLSEDELKSTNIESILLDDELSELGGKISEYFPFDGMLKFYDEEGNLKDLIFAEFKKYSDINNYKYKKYNSMKVLSESFEEMMKLMLIDTKEEINTIFNQYINKKITRTELATKLDKYVSNSSDDEDTETMMLDISKISKNLCSQYAYPGIPVKHTKFAKLEKSMVKDIVSFKTPEKFKEDVNHMLKVSRQIQFIQDLDEEQRVRDLTWYGAKDKANEYAEIIDDKVFSDGMAGDVLIFVGLSDAILACNYSQKVREGLIDGHPVNNLELVKSAYGNTYDHYNIPLSWFTTLKLPEVKKAKTKKKSVEI